MLWILISLNVLFIIANFLVLFVNPEMSRIIFIILGFLFLISGIRKTLILGLDNLRGRFWLLLSLTGLVFPVAAIFQSDILQVISRFYLSICLLFMFLGLKRQGLSLRGLKSIIWLILVIIVSVLIFLFSQILVEKSFINYLFLSTLALNFAILSANLLIYFGSDLGRRWLIGLLSFAFFFPGDPIYLLNNKDIAYFFYCFIFFFINIVAHTEE